MYLCQKTIQHQSTDRKWWSNIFSCTAQTQSYTPLFLHTHVFYHCCRMLRISRCAWNYHLGVVIIVRPHIVLQKKSVLKQKGWGGGMQRHNPSHCSSPCHWSSTISVALTLITTWGGWCYRKPDAPGEIALLHGDSPLFTSSWTGCLMGEREQRERRKEGCVVKERRW